MNNKISTIRITQRFFNLLFAAMAIAAVALSTSFSTRAQDDQFIEGGHYELLDEVQPVQTGDKIEVVELFWYRCPHCFRLEPYLIEWKKNIPENAAYIPLPAILNPQWEFEARAYFTFEALGVVEQVHEEYFNALHVQRRKIDSLDKLAEWGSENGLDPQAIRDTFFSFAVENKLNFTNVMGRKYGATGVPAIIVDGRYRTSVSLAGSHEKLIELINFLIIKAAEARTG